MSKIPVSPLAPARFPKLPQISGVLLAVGRAGVRYKGRDDLLLAVFGKGTTVAGLYTQSTMPGAPVDWCRKVLPGGSAAALVVNAGNANVFTGKAGHEAVAATVDTAAKLARCRKAQVMVASTGVIGEILPHERITKALPRLHKGLKEGAWLKAARTICTTDTFAKGATATCEIDGKPITINGFAKGSGMIAPDMATLLAFLFTDARIPARVLRILLRQANAGSFNAITVDSDTSTSDTLLLFATGKARNKPVEKAGDPRLKGFKTALGHVMQDLARQVVRDGEGASKFISVRVTGGASHESARTIARAVANSPLVKTAIAGEDANWGRIVMAVGKSAEPADRDRTRVEIGGVLIADKGALYPGYREADVVPHMKGREIDIHVDVGVGRGRATVWTCDLTHGYISINADYRS